MKLLRVGAPGLEKPAILHSDGTYRDLSCIVPELRGRRAHPGRNEPHPRRRSLDASGARARIFASAPASTRSARFICIGLNYADHAAETGAPIPAEPIIFMKATSAIIGPNDDVIIPKNADQARLGSRARRRHRQGSPLHRREGRLRPHCRLLRGQRRLASATSRPSAAASGTRARAATPSARSARGSSPPTRFADPQNLKMWLEVDGHRYQNGSTKTMIFGVATCVAYVSQFMSLQPGDIITTGTPPGVGMGIEARARLAQARQRHAPRHRRPRRADAERQGLRGLIRRSEH